MLNLIFKYDINCTTSNTCNIKLTSLYHVLVKNGLRNKAINIIFPPLLYPVTVKSTVHYSFKHHVFDAFATFVATSIFHHVFELLP